MSYIIRTKNISKTYGNNKALSDVSICIDNGDVYGLIGKNGAGKTTLLKIISNLAYPTSGEVIMQDNDILDKISALIESPGLYPNFDAVTNLKLKCIAYNVKDKFKIEDVLKTVGLSDKRKVKVKKYSLGMKQRLSIAMSLVTDPKVMILDEPINGLDPQGIIEIRNLIKEINEKYGVTIIISSHILDELLKVCNKFTIIDRGRVIQEISANDLMDRINNRLEFSVDNIEKAVNIINQNFIENIDLKILGENRFQVAYDTNKLGEINRLLTTNGVTVIECKRSGNTVEEYFVNLTGGINNA